MSDVRRQLRVVIQEVAERRHAEREAASSTDFADAILERWDLTPKPVVTDQKLGQMVAKIHGDNSFYHAKVAAKVGKRMLDQLEASGLKIVKVSE